MPRASRVLIGLSMGFVLLAALAGCRQGTFLGDRYNNFRAYYNTFYNARKAFDAGEEAIETAESRIDRSRFVSVFPRTQGGASGGTQFEEAIEKSADLLRERPTSKWADDALLLIGKSYFYQNNVVGAEGKFRETAQAALERDQPELADEARFWLGRTLALAERYEEATDVLEEGLARPDIEDRWRSRLLLALGELYVQQRRWDDAANALAQGIPLMGDGDYSGRAQFLLGQVLEADGRYEEAAQAYRAVRQHRPVYELSYAAQLSEALVLGIDAGRTDEALSLIGRMRRDDKNYQNRAEVELARARLLAADGKTTEAEALFRDLLYDEEFRGNNVRGETYYRYAEFFRDHGNDYVRAAAYFDTAATSVREEPGREMLLTRAAIRDVRRSAEVYASYASIATELEEADSLLYLGSLGDDAFAEAIAEIEQARLQEWQEAQQLLAARRAEQGFGSAPGVGAGEFPVDDPGRAAIGTGADMGVEGGFLNYRDPARVQDAMLLFERIWGERPLVPNWRRLEAIRGGAVQTTTEGVDVESGGVAANASGPPPVDISHVPRTEDDRDRLRAKRAELRYELGNVFFLSLAQPDSAEYWYRLVLREDDDHPVTHRARYALAETLVAQDRTEEAEALYIQVIEDDPASPQAVNARERLGLPPLEEQSDADPNVMAEQAYEQAYGLWQGRDFEEAIRRLLELGVDTAYVDVAPRALLAAATAFIEWTGETGSGPQALERGIPGALVPEELLRTADALAGSDTETPNGAEAPGATRSPTADREPDEAREETGPTDSPDEEGETYPDGSRAAESGGPEILMPDEEGRPEDPSVEPNAVDDSLPADTLAGPHEYLSLAHLYQIVEERYAGTEYASRAEELRLALLAILNPVEEEAAETIDEDPMAPLAESVVAGASEGTFGLAGDVPLDAEIGGFSWKVASVPSPLAAQAMLRNFGERGLRAAAGREEADAGQLFVLLLGQFASVEEAEASREGLPATGIGRDPEIVPITGMELFDTEDLNRFRAD